MDPTNNTTPTPNLNPSPSPAPGPAPVPATPAAPATSSGSASGSAPVPGNPTATPIEPVPVTPPVNPVFQPSGVGVAATEPIMRPEPAPAPDPVEEELKAPMTPAAPVPGSIGSAVSGPSGNASGSATAPGNNVFNNNQTTPSVSFNDPASQQNLADANKPTKKKTSKTTWILLIVVALVIVAALVVVLVMTLQGSSKSNIANNTNDSGTETNKTQTVTPKEEPEEEGVTTSLACNRAMNATELAGYDDVSSGTVEIDAEFLDGELSSISLTKSVTSSLDSESDGTTSKAGTLEAVAEEITTDNADDYYLALNSNGEVELSEELIQKNYEDLAFVCEIL